MACGCKCQFQLYSRSIRTLSAIVLPLQFAFFSHLGEDPGPSDPPPQTSKLSEHHADDGRRPKKDEESTFPLL